jgi:hypothetical protein
MAKGIGSSIATIVALLVIIIGVMYIISQPKETIDVAKTSAILESGLVCPGTTPVLNVVAFSSSSFLSVSYVSVNGDVVLLFRDAEYARLRGDYCGAE